MFTRKNPRIAFYQCDQIIGKHVVSPSFQHESKTWNHFQISTLGDNACSLLVLAREWIA
jgi:hypothetical protein